MRAEPDLALQRVARLAARALRVATAQISLQEGTGLRVRARAGPARPADRLCAEVIERGLALVLTDARDASPDGGEPAGEDDAVAAFLGVPLVGGGELLGVLCVMTGEPRHWTSDEVALLTDLGHAAGELLALHPERAGSLGPSVLASVPDTAVLEVDPELRVTMAEGLGFRHEGRSRDALVGRRLSDTLPAALFAAVAPRCLAAVDGATVSVEVEGEAGQTWSVQAGPVRDPSGTPRGASLVMRDVTNARARERALVEREAQYRLLADNSSDVISRHTPSGRFLYASPAARAVLGYDAGSLLDLHLGELVHPDDRGTVERALAGLDGPARPVTFGYRMRREDGEPAWLESTATAVCDETGRVQEVHCATRDVSPRHLAEDGRRASEALNETLFHALEEGVLVFAADGSIVAMNPSAERTVGSVAGARERAFPAAQMWDEQGEALAPQQLPWARVRATGEPQLGVVLAQEGARGGRIWLRINAVPLSGDAGERVLVSWAEITEIREAEERARFQADHDPLTGLPNRALLNRRLEAALAAARENQADVGLLFLDLDGFKAINDTVGHHGGDDLLCAVASRLARALRGGGDTAVRFSGDEFVVLVPEVEGGDGAGALADRLLEVLREPLQIGSTEHVVHASIGVAIAPKGDGEPEALLQQADAAMYQVKQAGGHGRRLYEPEMSRRSAQRRSTETALSHAIANDELELCYQPIWSLRRSRLDGFEALVRWRHPQRGLLMPTDFIPLAEQTGLSVNIGEWVLGVVCRQLRRWQTIEGTGKLSVNVNICARSLADFALPGRIADLLAEHELPPSRLGLEVTETMLMQQHEPARQTLTELHELGVRLSLDDFGTGYSSLSHLKDLPLDVLKIDRSFVAAPFDGTRQHAILGAIVTMAHSLGLEVVAEGVETEAQLTMLRRSECDFVQGFLLARPAKPEDVTSMLCDSRRLTSLPTRRWRRTERSRQSDDADQLAAGRET